MKEYKYALKLHSEEKYEEAYSLFLELANNNHADSQEMVANMTYHGSGIKKNREDAFYWYEQAAKNGNVEAQYWHGRNRLEQKS